MNTDLLWAIAVMLLLGLLKLGVAELQAWRASKSAQEHPALLPLAAVGLDIANAAIAWLSNNPAAKASDALAWAVFEWKASAPGLITAAGSAVTDASLKFAMTRKLLTAAQTSTLSEAAGKVITELAPSAITARVTPAQIVAVKADTVAALPPTIEDVVAALSKFPAIAALMAPPPAPASPPAATPTVADPAPAATQPALAPA